MLDFATALAQILTDVPRLGAERLLAANTIGRVLLSPLLATNPIPRFDASAMDGYAVRFEDCSIGVEIPVVGEARTGQNRSQLTSASSMRIFTGAALPVGADTVVMQERVRRCNQGIMLDSLPRKGENVRQEGEDLKPGTEALAIGTRVFSGTLMLAASLDQVELIVSQRPRVTVVCVGDELRPVGRTGPMGMIPESNSSGLVALAQQAGAEVVVLSLVADAPQDLEQAVASALARSDLLVTVGGVSVGDHDHAKAALEASGVAFDFWKVAIKPGKPVAFGRKGDSRILALPGNPASTLITFAVFGVPLLRAMQGDARPNAIRCLLPCTEDLRRNKDRLVLSLGNVVEKSGQQFFVPHRNQSSGATTALAASDGMAIIEAGDSSCLAGTPVEFLFWSAL